MALLLSAEFLKTVNPFTLNLLLQGNPEISDVVKYFASMKHPLIWILLITLMNNLHFNFLNLQCHAIYAVMQGVFDMFV